MERRRPADLMKPLAITTLLSLVAIPMLGMAFTKPQRQHILDRDDNLCQAPFKHRCVGGNDRPVEERKNQVHHIIPQRYSEEVGIEDPDIEENGLTLCKEAHLGRNGVHPDIAGAHSREDFKHVFEERQRKLDNHQIYWNDTWDRIFHVISLRNTQRFKKSGRIYPPKPSKS